MEAFVYSLITASPFFVFLVVLMTVSLICIFNDNFHNLIDFIIFNVFSEILKAKTDENNQTLVYLRHGKIHLQEETLKKVKVGMMYIFMALFVYVSLAFGQLALIEYTYECDDSKDCFQWPFSTTFSALRANCSDAEIIQGKKLVICYRLVFQVEFAVGVTYGMYKVCKILLSFSVTLITKLKKSRIKCLKVAVLTFGLTVAAIIIALTIIYKNSLQVMKFSAENGKMIFTICLGYVTAFIVIYHMPWVKIIEARDYRVLN